MIEAVNYLRTMLASKARSERGASAVEYGLLVALIAIIIIAAVTLLGTHLSDVFQKTANSVHS